MSAHLEGSRNSCALHGALQTLAAINGVVPVIHATAGCGVQNYLGGILASGGAAHCGGNGGVDASSNIGEKHVVFGGGSRLREQLKNTAKVVRGDLYAVLSGCATEMIGDDIPAMTKEAREQGIPAIFANTPGFRGDLSRGYELAVQALIEQLPDLPGTEVETVPNLVNIWGIIPQHDLFWQGDLLELTRILGQLGLTVNPLFGTDSTLEAWRRVPQAVLNLSFSQQGDKVLQLLEEKYGTPSLSWPGLPIGALASGRLVEELTDRLQLDQSRVEAVLQREEALFRHALTRLADLYFREDFQRVFAVVGGSAQVLAVTEFLVGSFGLFPALAVITDQQGESAKAEITRQLHSRQGALASPIFFSGDAGEIAEQVQCSGAELVLGSALEGGVARRLNAPLLQISFPLDSRLILNRSYAGYNGALTLLEDLGSAILSHRAQARKGYT